MIPEALRALLVTCPRQMRFLGTLTELLICRTTVSHQGSTLSGSLVRIHTGRLRNTGHIQAMVRHPCSVLRCQVVTLCILACMALQAMASTMTITHSSTFLSISQCLANPWHKCTQHSSPVSLRCSRYLTPSSSSSS